MEHEPELMIDPRPLLLKRLVWDIFPHDPDVVREAQHRLGLIPDDAEGLEVEHSASDTRVNRVAPLTAALHTLSGYAAEVIGHYLVASLEATDDDAELPDDEFFGRFARQNSEVIYDSVLAIIAHLMDTGVLEYGKKVRG